MGKTASPLSPQKAEELLLSCLKSGAKDRKQLVAACIDRIGLSPEELKDTSPGAPLNRAKCTIGSALSQLIRMGHLRQDENTITLVQSIEVAQEAIKRDPIIRNIILRIIGNSRCKKAELLNKVIRIYHEEVDSAEKESTIKADGGRILSDLLKLKEIEQQDKHFVLSETAPEASLQSGAGEENIPASLTEETDTQVSRSERNRVLFSRLSDEEFVNRSVELLECWYRKRSPTDSVKGANTDGSKDGGIDGNIEITDALWGAERIILQMKHVNSPRKKYIPLCEIQEFCGVLSAEKNAARGVFLTNAAYNSATVQFAQKYTVHKPFVLIDGEKWLALADSCGYALPDPEL